MTMFARLVLPLIACSAFAADVQTGAFQLTIEKKSPLSTWEQLVARFPADLPQQMPADFAYDIAKEPFDVYVPKSYDGAKAYGLIAFVSSNTDGGASLYPGLMDKHQLIWIGGTTVQNGRFWGYRSLITLDGVHAMKERYRIDDRRIFLCGFSGGAVRASLLATAYADIFTGGAIYLSGCKAPGTPASEQLEQLFAAAKKHSFVFMAGETDMNRDKAKAGIEAYRQAGFTHATYLEVPALDHRPPPPEWFEKALDFLDQPAN